MIGEIKISEVDITKLYSTNMTKCLQRSTELLLMKSGAICYEERGFKSLNECIDIKVESIIYLYLSEKGQRPFFKYNLF